MKVLVGNKYYFELGGTERYVLQLEKMLRGRGHEVIPFAMRHPRNLESNYDGYFVSPVDYDSLLRSKQPLAKVLAAFRAVYSKGARAKVRSLVQDTRPQVAHLHNIYHQISPSILPVLREAGVPVVLTLHDLKLLCPGYRMYSDGGPCERCAAGAYYHAARHRCLKDSLPASILAALEAYVHARMKTYERNVAVFIAPSRFLLSKISTSRLNRCTVEHLPHPIDLEAFQPSCAQGGYFVYFGRLAREKGVHTLLHAMAQVPSCRLVIAGDGPDAAELERRARDLGLTNVQFVGFRQGQDLRDVVRGSSASVVPSEWYENAPFAVYESFALGKPVVASRIGGIPELVEHGEDGLLFPAGDVDALAEHLSYLGERPALAAEMGQNGRRKAESLWCFENHYQRLLEIYQKAVDSI